MGRTIRGSIPGRGKKLLSPPKSSDCLWALPDLIFSGYRIYFFRGKAAEAWNCQFPYTAEVKNKWSSRSTPPYALMACTWTTLLVPLWSLRRGQLSWQLLFLHAWTMTVLWVPSQQIPIFTQFTVTVLTLHYVYIASLNNHPTWHDCNPHTPSGFIHIQAL